MAQDRDKLLKQLDALRLFPDNQLVRTLRKQIKTKLDRLEKDTVTIAKESPNITRSNKLSRYHNYIRQIQNNFPDLTYDQIRKQLAKRKRGESVSIPDAVWQNPSP